MSIEHMIQRAVSVREMAYCPYSQYKVGACIKSGEELYDGCNIENASYSLTICAERAALAKMISEGGVSWDTIVIATFDGAPPCGACLQTLSEFCKDKHHAKVVLAKSTEDFKTYTFSELLPLVFGEK